MNGELDGATYKKHEVFGLHMPTSCPEVPAHILDPKSTWADSKSYDAMANKLAMKFTNNFKQFENEATKEILEAAPRVLIESSNTPSVRCVCMGGPRARVLLIMVNNSKLCKSF